MKQRDIFKLIVIAGILILSVLLVNRISSAQDIAETELVKDAIRNAAVTCYAVEGAYPDSVEYLREHYQLAYDESRYFVTYEAFATNHIPDIYVTERGNILS